MDEPGGALLLSVLLRPTIPPELLFLVPVAVSLALGDAALDVARLEASTKWPNDIVHGDAKLGGVLTELCWPGPAVVVGLGVNLKGPLPEELAVAATTLEEASGVPVARDELLDGFLSHLSVRRSRLQDDHGRALLLQEYSSRCVTLGRQVAVELPEGEPLVGKAVAISRSGALVVAEASGRQREVLVGDVVHVRQMHQIGLDGAESTDGGRGSDRGGSFSYTQEVGTRRALGEQ